MLVRYEREEINEVHATLTKEEKNKDSCYLHYLLKAKTEYEKDIITTNWIHYRFLIE